MQSAQPGDVQSKFKITLRKSIVEEEYESETEGHVVVEGEIAPDSVYKKNSILKKRNRLDYFVEKVQLGENLEPLMKKRSNNASASNVVLKLVGNEFPGEHQLNADFTGANEGLENDGSKMITEDQEEVVTESSSSSSGISERSVFPVKIIISDFSNNNNSSISALDNGSDLPLEETAEHVTFVEENKVQKEEKEEEPKEETLESASDDNLIIIKANSDRKYFSPIIVENNTALEDHRNLTVSAINTGIVQIPAAQELLVDSIEKQNVLKQILAKEPIAFSAAAVAIPVPSPIKIQAPVVIEKSPARVENDYTAEILDQFQSIYQTNVKVLERMTAKIDRLVNIEEFEEDLLAFESDDDSLETSKAKPKKIYFCSFCDREFETTRGLGIHTARTHKNKK
jgi:hypothetical protein